MLLPSLAGDNIDKPDSASHMGIGKGSIVMAAVKLKAL